MVWWSRWCIGQFGRASIKSANCSKCHRRAPLILWGYRRKHLSGEKVHNAHSYPSPCSSSCEWRCIALTSLQFTHWHPGPGRSRRLQTGALQSGWNRKTYIFFRLEAGAHNSRDGRSVAYEQRPWAFIKLLLAVFAPLSNSQHIFIILFFLEYGYTQTFLNVQLVALYRIYL